MLAFILEQVPDNVSNAFLSQGIMGLVALLAIIVAFALYKEQKAAHERERQRADRAEAKLDEVYKALQEKYITALNEGTRAVADALARIREQS